MKKRHASSDKRTFGRTKTLMPACVVAPCVGVVGNCVVRDFSAGGARLQFHKSIALPAAFWLRLTGDGTLRYCTVKWHSKNETGVEFTRDMLLRMATMETDELRRLTSWGNQPRKVV